VDYDDDEPYVGNRPVVDLILHGPGGPKGATTAPVAVALVDTGADYGQLDLNLALYVGLDPVSQGVPVTVATAGGLVALHELVVDVEFLGQILPVTVHFASGAAPLLGRQGLFQAVQAAGFETTEWLQRWYPAAPATTNTNSVESNRQAEFIEFIEGLVRSGVQEKDPDVLLFYAVLKDDTKMLEEALRRGANTSVTDIQLMRRYRKHQSNARNQDS
jgi:predicted aspartyl protease